MAPSQVAVFLKTAAEQLRQRANDAPLTVVLGNEAADLDSTVASLLVAHLASLKAPDNDNRIYVPALPIACADLALRTDVTAFFAPLLPDAANLLFFQDDLPTLFSPTATRPESLQIFLTDFNSLPPSLAHLHAHVNAILDHHVDAHDYVHAVPRTIAAVGSATTLVILHYANLIASLPAAHRAEIATLALGPITVDTALFDVGMARATEADVVAADMCLAWRDGRDADLPAAGHVDATIITDVARTVHLVTALNDLHEHLHAAKLAISHLSTPDLLRKDYKEFRHPTLDNTIYGMASVTWDLRAWQHRDGVEAWREAVAQWARDRHLHSLFILTAFADDGRFTRQLAVVAPKEETIVQAVREQAPEVQLEPSEEGTYWWVRNIKMARKVIQPVLHRVLAKL
ncbi:Exopolyphosphatase [Allomyces javanicus]|nr:Exopolyphosphatase [Allomyces javanicus]